MTEMGDEHRQHEGASPSGENAALAQTEVAPPESNGAPVDRFIGQCLAGRYRIEKKVGRGGMGVVYEARHERLDKRVAIKVVRQKDDEEGREETLARFEREAKSAAGLNHEHVVNVIDYGYNDDGAAFMVMELLDGQSLDQLLWREGPLESGRAVAIARQVAKGLVAAHRAGIIHRDLKSGNVFLQERDGRDHVKLLDFGISKLVLPSEQDTKLTSTGMVVGTPNYMSPEQAKGQTNLDHRVDIYSLGIILFEMLTGEVPFTGKNFLEVAYKHVSEDPPPPSAVRPSQKVPPELDALVKKCLAKKPEDRFQSAEEFIEALPDSTSLPGGWSSDSLKRLSLPTSNSTKRAAGARRTSRSWVAVLLTILLGGGALGGYAFFRNKEESAVVLQGPQGRWKVRAKGRSWAGLGRKTDDQRAGKSGSSTPGWISLRILPVPAEAEVFLDGQRLGAGEQIVDVVNSKTPLQLTVQAQGYQAQTRYRPAGGRPLDSGRCSPTSRGPSSRELRRAMPRSTIFRAVTLRPTALRDASTRQHPDREPEDIKSNPYSSRRR